MMILCSERHMELVVLRAEGLLRSKALLHSLLVLANESNYRLILHSKGVVDPKDL